MSKAKIRETEELIVSAMDNKIVDSQPTEEFIRLEDKLRTCINNRGNIVIAKGNAK